jgi:hypothetical protein
LPKSQSRGYWIARSSPPLEIERTASEHRETRDVARVKMIAPEAAEGELTVFCGMWNYSNRLREALHIDLEPPEQRIDFQEK